MVCGVHLDDMVTFLDQNDKKITSERYPQSLSFFSLVLHMQECVEDVSSESLIGRSEYLAMIDLGKFPQELSIKRQWRDIHIFQKKESEPTRS